MFEAQRQWGHRLGPFGERFRYQYVISRQTETLEGFRHFALAGHNIHCGAELPVREIRDTSNRKVGYVLGIAVGMAARQTAKTLKLPLDRDDPDFWTRFEALIEPAAGRHAFIVHASGRTRMYTDPVAMIGAVYNRQDGYVASSPLLAIKRPVRPNPKFDMDVIENRGGKLSLFHTADEAVRRLNPNHCLDLDSLESRRFWPRDNGFTPEPADLTDIYAAIIGQARANIGAIADTYPCSLPVTGGMDSRLMLGFAEPHLHKIPQVYTHINNYATRRDAAIAGELCRVGGVEHETHDKRDFSMNRRDLRRMTRAFQIAFGAPALPPKEYLNGVIGGVTEGNVILRGHQTDLLRAVFVFRPEEEWRDPDWQIERLLIVPRAEFDSSVADRFRDDFLAWQADLPPEAMEKAADFMFLEVYYCATVGALFPALWRNFYLSPFNSRQLISLALRFSETRRRAADPVFELIELMNAELSRVPFDFEAPPSLEDVAHWTSGAPKALERQARTIASLVRQVS